MPYVFDQVNQELEGNENKKQNIFGEGNSPQASSQTGAAPTDQVNKTDASGSIGGGGPSAPTTNSGGGQTTPGDRQQVLNMQAKRQQAPKITEKIGQNLQKAGTDLQDEANNYVKGFQEKDYREGVDKDVLGKAIEGDQDAYNKSFGRAFKENYGNVDQFAPKTETELQSVKDLESTGGIKNLFKREMGPQYRDNEAAFDTMLLGRSPEFRKIQQELARQQQELINTRETEKVGRTKSAQELADTGFKTASEALKADLGGYQTDLENPLRQKEAEEEARRAAMDRAQLAREYEQAQAAALRGELTGRGGFEERAARQLGGIDPNEFVNIDTDVDWREFAGETEAQKFNRIMSLLGGKDTLQAGTGPGEAVNYNQQGIRDALIREAQTERRGIEDRYNQEIQQLLGQGNSAADQFNLTRGRSVDQFKNDAFNQFKSGGPFNDFSMYASFGAGLDGYTRQLNNNREGSVNYNAAKEQLDRGLAGLWDAYSNEAMSAVDANKFYKQQGKLSGKDVLTREQADRLNMLASETGNSGGYGAGAGSYEQDSFDRDAYTAALRDYLLNKVKPGGSGARIEGFLGQQMDRF